MGTGMDPMSSGTMGGTSMVPVKRPTVMGRIAEVATAGAWDPTGGEDTTKQPFNGQPTKFGALMKVLAPAMHGAMIGGFEGKSTPGGGFAAANNFYQQQRIRQMQMAQFMQQMQLNQSTIAKNTAEAQWAQRRPLVTRTAPSIKGKDAQGNDIYMSQNPETGAFEPVPGITPEGAPSKEISTDRGIVTYDPTNPQRGAIPLTLAGGSRVGSAADAKNDLSSGSAQSASEPSQRTTGAALPTKFNSGSPRLPGSASPAASPQTINARPQGGIPLHAPGFGKPKPVIRPSRNAAGVEQDHMIDTDPDSRTFGQDLGAIGTSRQPLPDRTTDREKNRDAQKADDVARSEQYAAAALAKSGGDPDKAVAALNSLKIADPNAAKDFNRLLPQIRKSITDRAKQRKPKTKAPFGLSDQDWNAITGNQAQPAQEQPNQ